MSRPRRQSSFIKRPREELQQIAIETLTAVERGSYELDGETHTVDDLSKIPSSTDFHTPDSALAQWASSTPTRIASSTSITLYHNSTLEGVRFLQAPRIGVLNFASATSPGGGFLWGARAQEESLARSSNLYSSLNSPVAAPFYAQHNPERAAHYTHAMLYTRGVCLVRDDEGSWVTPRTVDVVTSPAVNARELKGVLRQTGKLARGEERLPPDEAAEVVRVMRERMARILFLLHREGVADIVLGSFGTGAFENDVEAVARIWAELLAVPGAHFHDVFQNVVFAIIDRDTYRVFRDVFRGLGVSFVEEGAH